MRNDLVDATADDFSSIQTNSTKAQPFKIAWPVLVVFSFFLLFGIIGNLLVIYVICSRQRLRNVTNFLLLNLAAADVLFLVIGGGFAMINYLFYEWPLGGIVCRLTHFLMFMTCYVSVYTLVAVTAVRYSIVVNGLQFMCVRTRCQGAFLIASLWIIFLVAKIPVLLIHDIKKQEATGRIECVIIGAKQGRHFFTTFFVFGYALPLSVIASLNVLIVRYLREKKRNLSNHSHVSPIQDRTRHVTKTVLIVVIVFAVVWLPLHLHLLITYSYGNGTLPNVKYYKIMVVVFHCFCFFSPVFNPIIYNFCSEEFRLTFKEVVFCIKSANIDNHPQDHNSPPVNV
ncbi:unnamed protein product [Dimorphilus gyrociliatus]|uniref:G-protein coupled receptors family 1 profile domain-containing protein n=1 Tax=Dimorphilus gyrociliatus TaxID=2664684 RepID=A0A7I8W0X5_9ANNE|nr:unnamed protein product [Dimorphilus gyrociliatus]